MGLEDFIAMLVDARTSFNARWCPGEEEPCYEVTIEGECREYASFAFNGEGSKCTGVLVA